MSRDRLDGRQTLGLLGVLCLVIGVVLAVLVVVVELWRVS